jgi:hypothetical protein
MESDAGEQLAWRLEPTVIAEATRFKAGAPMIVIYRQLAANERRVTAVAFPGTAKTPLYFNRTGTRLVLRGAPAVDGACGRAEAGPVSESTIPDGGLAEVTDACWCCAPAGESCTPGNKTGQGRPCSSSASSRARAALLRRPSAGDGGHADGESDGLQSSCEGLGNANLIDRL